MKQLNDFDPSKDEDWEFEEIEWDDSEWTEEDEEDFEE